MGVNRRIYRKRVMAANLSSFNEMIKMGTTNNVGNYEVEICPILTQFIRSLLEEQAAGLSRFDDEEVYTPHIHKCPLRKKRLKA